ncbi:MAG TPA: MFS transporter [Anaeromyxobacter sp.]|nr:MFS transporter [Anaeromyxobacter sp.]
MTHSRDRSSAPAPARGAAPLTVAVGATILARAVAAGTVESLRAELWLTDQALGTLVSAFAGSYVVGLPAGVWLAVRGGRLRGLAAGLLVCGAATAASAAANGFSLLALGRGVAGLGAGIAVGAGADVLWDRGRAPRAGGGIVLGAASLALAYLLGGLCGRWPGWRGAFVLSGALLAAAAGLCAVRARALPAARWPAWETLRAGGGAALRRLAADRGRVLALLGAVAGAVALSASAFWIPALLVRVRTAPRATAGVQLAAAVLAAAVLAEALCRAALRSGRERLGPRWLASGGAAAAALGFAAALLWTSPAVALPALMVGMLGAAVGVRAALAAAPGADAPALLGAVLVLVHGVGELSGAILLGALADRATFGRALGFAPAAFLAAALLWAAAAASTRAAPDEAPASDLDRA